MEELASGLREHGFLAWAYETDTLPGPTYLAQVVQAIEGASALILIVSPEALGSHQVAREIEVAHDLDRPIIPVLKGITHEKLQKRRPDWRLALGGSTSVAIPDEGVPAIVPRIVEGLRALGVAPGATPQPSARSAATGQPRAPRLQVPRGRALLVGGGLLAAVLAALAVVLFVGGGQEQKGNSASTPVVPPSSQTESGLAGVNGTLRVDPSAIASGQKARVSYSITNRSGHDIHATTTDISIVVGQSLNSVNVIIGSVSKDIPAGHTIQGSLTSDFTGVDLGRQNVMLTIGNKIQGGVVNTRILAKESINLEG